MALLFVVVTGLLGLVFAVFLARDILRRENGNEAMQSIASAIRSGAEAFLRRQNRTIGYMSVLLACLIYILYAFVRSETPHDPASASVLAFWTTVSFLFGAGCSVLSGYIGMWTAIRANSRTAAGALRGMNNAFQAALRGGAVSGFSIVALSLLGKVGS